MWEAQRDFTIDCNDLKMVGCGASCAAEIRHVLEEGPHPVCYDDEQYVRSASLAQVIATLCCRAWGRTGHDVV